LGCHVQAKQSKPRQTLTSTNSESAQTSLRVSTPSHSGQLRFSPTQRRTIQKSSTTYLNPMSSPAASSDSQSNEGKLLSSTSTVTTSSFPGFVVMYRGTGDRNSFKLPEVDPSEFEEDQKQLTPCDYVDKKHPTSQKKVFGKIYCRVEWQVKYRR